MQELVPAYFHLDFEPNSGDATIQTNMTPEEMVGYLSEFIEQVIEAGEYSSFFDSSKITYN